MKNKFHYFLMVVITIVIFDVIASFASKIMEFEYTSLAWVSLFLYTFAGFFGCKYFNFSTGVIAGLIAGFTDSTLGWALSSIIKPHLSLDQTPYTFSIIAEIIITVSITGIIFGLIGSAICYVFKQKYKRETI